MLDRSKQTSLNQEILRVASAKRARFYGDNLSRKQKRALESQVGGPTPMLLDSGSIVRIAERDPKTGRLLKVS